MISRRALVAGACVAAVDCSRREGAAGSPQTTSAGTAASAPSSEPARPAPGETRLLEWELGTGRAVAVVPTWAPAGERFPVVVALHGRGESLKAPAVGAMGWPRDYELVRAVRRLRSPPLSKDDFEGFVDDASLAAANRELAAAPFRGLVVVCPYVPDLDLTREGGQARYGRFVLDELLARARRETPVIDAAPATGIDGVSLGGAVALYVGLTNPLSFGAVGGIQPALHAEDVALWTERAVAARAKNPNLKLRLLTSEDDYFREVVTRVSQAWRQAGVAHDFAVALGPHDYVFNRGPGSIELLRWHERVLARG
jgi:enterochelin esterase-like enzyme